MSLDKDVLDAEEIKQVPRAFVVISRKKFRLTVFRRSMPDAHYYEKTFSCPIAVGAIGHTTPGGPFFVISKKRHPDWWMPNASWVPEEKRGQVVSSDDPLNPIREAWICFKEDPSGNIGIHGTDTLWSLGSRASHGCVRVRPEDAINLYNIIPVGAPVYVR